MRYLANAAWYCDSRLCEKCKKVSETRLWFFICTSHSNAYTIDSCTSAGFNVSDVSGLWETRRGGATLLRPIRQLCPTTAWFPSAVSRKIVISINCNYNELDSSEISLHETALKGRRTLQNLLVLLTWTAVSMTMLEKNKDEGNGIRIP